MRFPLATLWFFYMAAAGCFYPYYGLYLRQTLGLSASQVGLVIAVMPFTGLIAQPLWGRLADHSGSRQRTLALAMVGVAAGCGVLMASTSFAALLLATSFFALSATAAIPMCTAVTLAGLPNGIFGFGPVRMWGTIGYGVAVLCFPWVAALLASTEEGKLFWLLPATAACALLAAARVATLPPAPGLAIRSGSGDFGRLLRHPPIRRLVLFAFLSHLCMQGPIQLLPVLLDGLGGGVEAVRTSWLYMLALEIPLVGFASTAWRRLGPRGLLLFGLTCEGARWVATALAGDLATVEVLQLLHGCSTMGVLIGVPLYIDAAVPARLRSTGQTLVSGCGFGIGAIVSTATSGWLYDHVAPTAPYLAGGVGALLLSAGLFALLPVPYRPHEPPMADAP
jgi:PPP family 3-phenylpropionic acid transporter